MSYLYRRGKGAARRVMHLAAHSRTGQIIGSLCGKTDLNTSINVPLARPICKLCRKAAQQEEG